MKRENDVRTVQTSLYLTRSWRANTDMQLLIYDSPKDGIDISEVSRLTDYIVSYVCKGTESLVNEKRKMIELVLNSSASSHSITDVKRIAKQVLNASIKDRVISKQECMCQIGQLPLSISSEDVKHVSLSGQHKLGTSQTASYTDLARYANRKEHQNLSLHEWLRARHPDKVICYLGGRIENAYPVTAGFARSVLLVHKPWEKVFPLQKAPEEVLLREFHGFIQDPVCPRSIKISYERERMRYEENRQSREPTQNQDEDNNYAEVAENRYRNNAEAVNLVSIVGANCADVEENLEYNFDFGLNDDWSRRDVKPGNLTIEETSKWLDTMIQKDRLQQKEGEDELGIPLRTDGTEYKMENCKKDQKEIIYTVLKNLKELHANEESWKPLHMTIRGKAGTGKSVLINTITSNIRRLFQSRMSVAICGPTGSAAFSAGGETCHRFFHISQRSKGLPTSAETQRELQRKLKRIVALIIDERSMLDAMIVGRMELYCRNFSYGGKNKNKQWGGIPIVLFVGDDYQLPAIGWGALHVDSIQAMEVLQKSKRDQYEKHLIQEGWKVFKEMGEKAMLLSISKRVNEKEKCLLRVLKGARCENIYDTIDDSDVKQLMRLHLRSWDENGPTYSSQEIQSILENGLALFAQKEPRDRHNMNMLNSLCTKNGTSVARVKARTTSHTGRRVINNAHYDEDRTPPTVLLTKGCKVQLTGSNIYPLWGLYHGSMGTLLEIIFSEGESPNSGDLPLYAMCDFPQYHGERLSQLLPRTYVPIPVREVHCINRTCKGCKRTYLPLTLAFAKTGHTFQGQNVGPTDDGQIPNAIKHIIVDPGNQQFEGRNPGLLYTFLSRVTTLGNKENKFSSAIYFQGDNASKERFQFVSVRKVNQKIVPYHKVLLRDKWVKYLEENTMQNSGLSSKEKSDLTRWCQSTNLGTNDLEMIFEHIIK